MDIVLLLGPLYHLLERSERLQALTDARRVLGDRLADDDEKSVTLELLARVEAQPSLVGMSAHLLALGMKPAPSY